VKLSGVLTELGAFEKRKESNVHSRACVMMVTVQFKNIRSTSNNDSDNDNDFNNNKNKLQYPTPTPSYN
jgi:hypothetical protein